MRPDRRVLWSIQRTSSVIRRHCLHPSLFNSSVSHRSKTLTETTAVWRHNSIERPKVRKTSKPTCRRTAYSPVWTRRWALRWDDLPYIFPQPVKGQQCLFSGESCCLAAAALLLRATLLDGSSRGASLPSAAFNRQGARSCVAASPPPPRHLPAFGMHLFKSSRIIATICKVLLSWLSFSVSSVRPGGRTGTQSAETETAASDITAANPDGRNEGRNEGTEMEPACE